MSRESSSLNRTARLVAVVAALTLGCAPLQTNPAPDATAEPRRRAHLLTQADIDQAAERGSYGSIFDLIAALRPAWFQHRGQASLALNEPLPDVYVDGIRFPGTALREIALSQASRLEFLTASEATIRFGTQEGVGAVLVTTRRR